MFVRQFLKSQILTNKGSHMSLSSSIFVLIVVTRDLLVYSFSRSVIFFISVSDIADSYKYIIINSNSLVWQYSIMNIVTCSKLHAHIPYMFRYPVLSFSNIVSIVII